MERKVTKLNKAIREEIIANALKKSPVAARTDAYNERYYAWVEKCRIESLGGAEAEKKLIKASEKLEAIRKEFDSYLINNNIRGRSFHYSGSGIRLNIAGCAYVARFKNKGGNGELRPALDTNSGQPFAITADNPLAIEFFELEEERKTIESMNDLINAQVMATVNSCTTIEKLLKVWPECVELLPPSPERIVASLPSVDVKSLNTMIGLPSDKQDKE